MLMRQWTRPAALSARSVHSVHSPRSTGWLQTGPRARARYLSTGAIPHFPRGVAVHGRSTPQSELHPSSDLTAQWRVYVNGPSSPRVGPATGAAPQSPSGPLASLERAWTTDFGSIRLDSANQPQCHGQQDRFESVPNHPTQPPPASPSTGGVVQLLRPLADPAPDRDFWFENDDSLTRPDVGRTWLSRTHSSDAPSPSIGVSARATPGQLSPLASAPMDPPPTPVTSTVLPGLGWEPHSPPASSAAPGSVHSIDEQYFTPVATSVPTPAAPLSPMPLGPEIERVTDLNPVDEQYFRAAPMVDTTVSTDESDTRAMRQLVHDATQDLSWVDQQLFSDPASPSVPEKPRATLARPSPRAPKASPKSTALAFVEALRKHPEQLESGPQAGDRLWNDSLMKRLSSAAQVKDASEAMAVITQDDATQEPPSPKLGSKLNDRFKPPDLEVLGSLDIIEKLKHSIIFDNHDIVAINKPYGLEMYHKGSSSFHALDKYLPDLAKHFDVPELLVVHRLDKKTTGVLLLAKSKLMQSTLTDLFRQRKIDKRYWAIAKGMAEPSEGIINIPLGEACLDKRFRMTVRPLYSNSDIMTGLKNPKGQVLPAVTEYRVLSLKHRMQLIEAKPITGFRHQIRAHLSLGIKCPILGDHVYDKVDSVGKPQRLPPYALEKLGIRASAARHMPLCLHAKHIQIPEIVSNKNVWVDAALPHHFNRIMNKLNLKPSRHVKI
ncbi:hypothetical protein TCAL_04816 [Tigriopus californicus]|uniref:Pseudouridylate synthase RPUSD4, mitochondrial n=1 Tax=Tigriopus californicus TaxID=6832 RepID=A0A553NZC2_TIGCA|nr:uncharacterized protein LOC131886292 [Tigriopus californicus]TRY70793.1 hypothetical protein TCAL_04816 [Tigriopus californicus]